MKIKARHLASRSLLLGAFGLAALALTACGSSHESWAGVSGNADRDTVIVSFEKNVTSLAADETRNWSYRGDGKARFYAPAIVADERVYVGDYKGRIHAIRREDGKADWVYEPERTAFLGFTFGANDRILAPIALGDGELFVGTEHGVYALDISEEKPGEKWSFDTEHSVWAQPLYVNDPELGPPTLFVASLDQHLYALDPDTGRSRWSIDLDGALVGQPTLDVEHSRLYIATLNYEVYAISLDGEEEDSYATRGWVWGSPVLHDSRLYFGDLKGWLYEVEITDEGFGDDWSRQLADGALRAAPIIIEDTLVAASDDQKVYAVNLTDRSVSWEKDVEAPAVTDITWVMHDDEPVVVVGTKEKDTLLVALRLSDGNKEWAYKYDD